MTTAAEVAAKVQALRARGHEPLAWRLETAWARASSPAGRVLPLWGSARFPVGPDTRWQRLVDGVAARVADARTCEGEVARQYLAPLVWDAAAELAAAEGARRDTMPDARALVETVLLGAPEELQDVEVNLWPEYAEEVARAVGNLLRQSGILAKVEANRDEGGAFLNRAPGTLRLRLETDEPEQVASALRLADGPYDVEIVEGIVAFAVAVDWSPLDQAMRQAVDEVPGRVWALADDLRAWGEGENAGDELKDAAPRW